MHRMTSLVFRARPVRHIALRATRPPRVFAPPPTRPRQWQRQLSRGILRASASFRVIDFVALHADNGEIL